MPVRKPWLFLAMGDMVGDEEEEVFVGDDGTTVSVGGDATTTPVSPEGPVSGEVASQRI